MATAGNSNICYPISTKELERRWAAVRKAMGEQGIDVLIAQSHNSYHSGYTKWFTDMPALYGGYESLIFPRDEKMILVRHGPEKTTKIADNDPVHRGIAKILQRPTFAAVHYTGNYASQAMIDELKPWSGKTIGYMGANQMSYTFLDHIKNGPLSNSKFVDASDLVDNIKVIKSPEELDMIRACAAMQVASMEAVAKEIRPGKKVFELAALAQYEGELRGSEAGLFLAQGGPLGKVASKISRHQQNYELKDGDQFTLLIENNGPGGMYTELGRTFVMGKAPSHMTDELEFVLKAQAYTVSLLKPGADCREILTKYNDFMVKNGRPKEERLYAHGQGYDLVERPMIFPEETMKIQNNMNIVVHPTYATDKDYSWTCDNFLVLESGIEPIHHMPQKIFEV